MTEENIGNTENTEAPLVQDELATLKKRADMMGLKYHHRVGVKKLKAAIEDHLASKTISDATEQKKESKAAKKAAKKADKAAAPQPESRQQRIVRLRKEAASLVRIQIANMNPLKKDYDGEIYCVSNSQVGTFKKYVPFNTPWHVPQIIVNHLLEKECQIFHTINRNGQKIREGKLIKELNVQILPPLTAPELKDLGQQQAMARGQ